MGKGNKGGNAAKQVAPVAVVVQAATVVRAGKPAQPGVLQVKAGAALRGARAAWYGVLLAYNGKPVAEFLAATTATPPSLPKSGVQEKATGWLGWFVRNGLVQVVQPAATAQPTPENVAA